MKTLIVLILISVFVCSCSGFTYNGIRGDDLRNASIGDAAAIGAGIGARFLVHWAGHVAYFEANGIDWHQEGLSEIVETRLSDSEAAWGGRAGFLSELGVGYAMKLLGFDNKFTRAYNTASMVSIAVYPASNEILVGNGGDFDMIDRDSNGDLEWAAYTALAIGLNIKTGD